MDLLIKYKDEYQTILILRNLGHFYFFCCTKNFSREP